MNTEMDKMLTFLDVMMLAQEGKDPSQAIENQEKRGQQSVVKGMRLPKKTNEHTVPREISQRGVTNSMSYEERRDIVHRNIYEYTKTQYELMGIVIEKDFDDLFWSVSLPAGWEIRATDHTMWNELIDDKGRKRGTFFYKAAFYDRDAFMNFETRYRIEVTHIADPDADYDVWSASDYQGRVYDSNNIIYSTATIKPTGSYFEDDKLKDELYAELETFMKANYPNYTDIQAYWNEN